MNSCLLKTIICQHDCSCNGPLERVKEAAPGTYTLAIMIGDDLDHDTTNSVFMSADNQVLENVIGRTSA